MFFNQYCLAEVNASGCEKVKLDISEFFESNKGFVSCESVQSWGFIDSYQCRFLIPSNDGDGNSFLSEVIIEKLRARPNLIKKKKEEIQSARQIEHQEREREGLIPMFYNRGPQEEALIAAIIDYYQKEDARPDFQCQEYRHEEQERSSSDADFSYNVFTDL